MGVCGVQDRGQQSKNVCAWEYGKQEVDGVPREGFLCVCVCAHAKEHYLCRYEAGRAGENQHVRCVCMSVASNRRMSLCVYVAGRQEGGAEGVCTCARVCVCVCVCVFARARAGKGRRGKVLEV
jgi:hypothetical protein